MAATILLSIAGMDSTPQTPDQTSDEYKKNFLMKEVMFWLYHVAVVVLAALLITFGIRAQQEIEKLPTTDSYARAM